MTLTLSDEMKEFTNRHIGPRDFDLSSMLQTLKVSNLDELIEKAAPKNILSNEPMDIGSGMTEEEFLKRAKKVASKNQVFDTYLGLGYYDCITPKVILRNVLENPGWYTAYTPYQAEISQGRMEALINFQTMVSNLTGMDLANASLLDEGTAAAEAMALCKAVNRKNKSQRFFVSEDVFPQTLEVVSTRAKSLGIEVLVGNPQTFNFEDSPVFAALLQYPGKDGALVDYTDFCTQAHKAHSLVIAASDIMALTQLKAPGEWGADVAVGSTQRFGVPMGYGGPHAAFIATKDAYKRSLPGRIIGQSVDSKGQVAYRLALQTREQHIRREKATSNICTAQVLLAVMASMYAVYHGPKGLKKISRSIHLKAKTLAQTLEENGFKLKHSQFFDTITLNVNQSADLVQQCLKQGINISPLSDTEVSIAVDEAKTLEDLEKLVSALCGKKITLDLSQVTPDFATFERKSEILPQEVFNKYHSETDMLRYISRLEKKDLSLNHSMIPLGSCTMKLNSTTEMIPVTWPEFGKLHPFAPISQARGYIELIQQLEGWLCEITGFDGASLQPNAGSQGEYAGLMVIKKYHEQKNQSQRNICIIPTSAHGTNPASAVMAGMKVVTVDCDENGNIDVEDLRQKSQLHHKDLAALMVTYPSTHGVFEESIVEICEIIHSHGGQVYMDGANLNALVGIAKPGKFGPDVCHLNLHKTFCIPHGGGGPGVGPIVVGKHLKNFLPTHGLVPECGPAQGVTAISAAPYGSASILPISWAYIAMMGSEGLKKATQVSILNANYIAKKLEAHYPILYKGRGGWVAHECIIDVRDFKDSVGVNVDDIAKRLMDYGFHAPTMSWPVAGTLMIEPTESESLEELDRFCEAMIQIREEIREIENGQYDQEDNVLKNAPHSYNTLISDQWNHKYGREKAAFPLSWIRDRKFWVSVDRVDNAFGDRNLVCSCS